MVKGVLEGFSKFGTKIGFQCLGKAGLFAGGSLAGGAIVDGVIGLSKKQLGINISPPETNIHDIKKQKDEDKKRMKLSVNLIYLEERMFIPMVWTHIR